jgi:hypothetical protein
MRQSWSKYLLNINALIYIIDASDEINMELSKMELYNLLNCPVI